MTTTTHTLSNLQDIWLSTFTGEVLSEHKTSSTSVHQEKHLITPSGGIIPGKVYSETHIQNDVWLRSSAGEETQVNLGGIGLPIRVGHVVTVVWGATKDCDSGVYLGARNQTTGDVRCNFENILKNNDNDEAIKKWKLDFGLNKAAMQGAGVGAVIGGIMGTASGGGVGGWLACLVAGCVLGAIALSGMFLQKPAKTMAAEISDFVKGRLTAV